MNYQALLDRKTSWSPAPMEPEAINYEDGRLDTIWKAIALGLALELPVGQFTLSASKGDLPNDPAVIELLLSNTHDEEVHFAGFQAAERAYGCPTHLKEQANEIAQLLIEHPDHTVVKAGYMELGVFFVTLPLIRKLGDVGLKMLSENISRDEATHVATNYQIIDQMGLKASQSLSNLRVTIINWLTEDLKIAGMGRQYWLRQSERLVLNREAPDLSWTKVGQTPAFFEISNASFSRYSI